MQHFPQPHRFGKASTRWSLSELLIFEATRDGREPREFDPANEIYLSTAQVARRYAVGRTTIWRWARDAQQVAA